MIAEILPLVEFQLDDGISDTEAIHLIETPVYEKTESTDGWKEQISDTHEALQLDIDADDVDDPFTSHLISVGVS